MQPQTMDLTKLVFEWPQTKKQHQGRYGPVFLAMAESGTLIYAEQLELQGPALNRAVDFLHQKTADQLDHELYTVPYLGLLSRDGHVFLLTQVFPGGSMSDVVRQHGVMPAPLARTIIRSLVIGVEQIRASHGVSVVLPDADNIRLDNLSNPKIEPPLLDLTVLGHHLPSALLALPEVVSGQAGGLRNADSWLIGIIAAKMLSGRPDLLSDYVSATSLGAQLAKKGWKASALELLLPDHMEILPQDPSAVDFLHQCLIVDGSERPDIAKLLDHPFIAGDHGEIRSAD